MIFKILKRQFFKFGRNEIFENILPFKSEKYFDTLLKTKKQTVYLGIDPTANSLQIGNIFPLLALLRMWSGGHNIIIVIGGATGLIGDPIGRITDRAELKESIVVSNVNTMSIDIDRIVNNYKNIIGNGAEFGTYRLLNNIDWYKDHNIVTFLSTVLKYFRFSDLKGKRSLEERLSSNNSVNMKEFFYPFLQAYDWLHLYREFDCRVQIGGDDQQGNMQLGQILIDKADKANVYGLTVPLFVIGGEKVGKSNPKSKFNVNLNAESQSPFSLYCTCLHVPNSLIIGSGLMRRLTALSEEEVETLMAQHSEHPKRQILQRALAEQMVHLVHGDAVLEVVTGTQELFSPADRDSFDRCLRQANNSQAFLSHVDCVPHVAVGRNVRTLCAEHLFVAGTQHSGGSGGSVLFNGRPVGDAAEPLCTVDAARPICGVLQIGSGGKWLVVRKG